ncbi:Transcriptional activator protein CzcR [Pirellulimonas nuda]|uniref:Transcriptional activator protein CzcR n=1 Tax=Pirellulimonas nuda TaxID=2528009 RepID=A0A518D7V2_9BACT|nr:response regulator [Pirellulimonas nuda]QDU87546.1 Transcriptional activator protein CzcR [Pirellulimonas nuda]
MGQTRYRTLIVDSEPTVRDVAHRAMTGRNMQCDRASNGAEALAMFDAHSYDVVVTELWMPEFHGHALACNLLDRPDPPRIVVLSGLDEPRLLADLRARGVDDTYVKPVDFGFLAERVEQLAGEGADGRPAAPQKLLLRIEESILERSKASEALLKEALDASPAPLADPPPAISEFASRTAAADAAADAEAQRDGSTQVRRSAKRVTCLATAVAAPITRALEPAGDPFKIAIRDLSQSGIRLLNTRAVSEGYLALAWPAECIASTTLCVAIRVTRCQPIARFYDIGGQFLLDG